MGQPARWYRRLATRVGKALLARPTYGFDKETLLGLRWFFGWVGLVLAVVSLGYAIHLGDWSPFGRSSFFVSAAVLWGSAGAYGIWRVRRVRRGEKP